MIHQLKTWPEYFKDVLSGYKKFELRKNDRDFKKGDYLILREYEPDRDSYTGREITAMVDYVLSDCKELGILDGHCIMSINTIMFRNNK